VSGPILPVEEDPCACRLDERDLHRVPVGGTRDLLGLVMWGECSRTTPSRRQIWSGLTAGEVFKGDLISPSVFAISHSAQSISVACSRSPSTKLSIFLLTLTRVASVVESSIHMDASWLANRHLISSYLHLSQCTVDFGDVSRSLGCESAKRLLDDVALSQFTADVIQGKGLKCREVVLQ
jgi:hypothetical protein